MALRQSTRFRAATAFLGVLSFVLAVVAELKNPPYGTPIRGADVIVCRFPPDATVAALGALSALVAACCAGIGAVSVFFPYDGRSIPRKALFDYTMLHVFFHLAIGVTVAGIGMTTWATATEAHVRNVHRDLGYACPTAETGLLGAAAFLNL
ncbi:hypothetical protein VPH35_015707 [Triticum aestivum]|uniref:Uncharacterized protein n=1 Tax=Aegilops tauschii TaxID=37682 RepID=M8BA45_AEGTA